MSEDLPSEKRVLDAIDATWPAEEILSRDGWQLRRGAPAAGNRVTAATPVDPGAVPEIAAAEAAMRGWGQEPVFRIATGDDALGMALSDRGYRAYGHSAVYVAALAQLDDGADQTARAIRVACPLAVVDEIWRDGGVGPSKRAVMARVAVPSAVVVARLEDRPVGAAFIACDEEVSMIYSIEVRPVHRRKGAGGILFAGAARFAREHGAEWLGLAVTEGNMPARRLYEKLGMRLIGSYHYCTPES